MNRTVVRPLPVSQNRQSTFPNTPLSFSPNSFLPISALQFSEPGVKRVTAGSSHGNPTWLPQGNSTGEIPQRETSILAARHLWERLQPRRVVGEPPMTVFAVQGVFAVETAPTQTSRSSLGFPVVTLERKFQEKPLWAGRKGCEGDRKMPFSQQCSRLEKRQGVTVTVVSLLDGHFIDQFLEELGTYSFYCEKILSVFKFAVVFAVLNNGYSFFIANPRQPGQGCFVCRIDIDSSQGDIDCEKNGG